MALSKQQIAKLLDEKDKMNGSNPKVSSPNTTNMHMGQPFPHQPQMDKVGYRPMPGYNNAQGMNIPALPKLAPAASVMKGPSLPGPSKFPKLKKKLGGF
jgi:hypothetical protein